MSEGHDDLDAIHLGHGDIEEHHIGLEMLDNAESLEPIGRLAYNLDVSFLTEDQADSLTKKPVIVSDYDLNSVVFHLIVVSP